MKEISVENWAEFESRRQELLTDETSAGHSVEILYRGQGDAGWGLTTTLERRGHGKRPIIDYYNLIFRLSPQIGTFTGEKWEMRTPPEVQKQLESYDGWCYPKFPGPAEYSYMAHLRHHDFPSPLLDWTRSPYIAAFFAFRPTSKPSNGMASIYAFSESPQGIKLTSSDEPQIRVVGPCVQTHRRHFLQQCDYTMCAQFLNVGGGYEWHFIEHEAVTRRDDASQDYLWKFNIPWSERLNVLRLLDAYNLNAFSLFESEEALMQTLATREMEFGGRV